MRFITAILLVSISFTAYSKECNIDVYGNAHKYPKVFLNEDGKAQGILIDMMEYIGDKIDCSFNYKLSPWQRAYVEMLNGKGMIIGLSKNEEREKILDYSDVMFIDDLRVVTRKDKNLTINTIDDLSNLTVGLSRGASYGSKFEKALKANLFKPNFDNGSLSSRLKMVMIGRTDAAIISPGSKAFESALEGDTDLLKNRDKFQLQENSLRRDPNFLGYVKSAYPESLLNKINAAIKEGTQSKYFESLELKYIGN